MKKPAPEFISNPNLDIAGTYLQGYIQATEQQLRQVFGEPATAGGKVSLLWAIRSGDGTIATIYQRTAGQDTAPVSVFHIGGHHRGAVSVVHQHFRKALGLGEERQRAA